MTFLRRWSAGRVGRRARAITSQGARQRAARGAAYLDEVDPGWYEGLDPDAVELADGQSCILGQLHGDFRTGLGRARLLTMGSAPRASLSPVALGFLCVQGVPEEAQARDYAYLNAAWDAEVGQRLDRRRGRSEPTRRPPGEREAASLAEVAL